MVNVELLADNLVLLMKEVASIPEVAKYLSYDQKNPLSFPDVDNPNSLILKKIHPYPFDPIAQTVDTTEVRIYYPEGVFDGSGAVADSFVYFDIITAKSLWLISDGKSSIRPYMIMKYLVDHFTKKSIDTLGRIQITNFAHLHINQNFDALRLEANMTIFGA